MIEVSFRGKFQIYVSTTGEKGMQLAIGEERKLLKTLHPKTTIYSIAERLACTSCTDIISSLPSSVLYN
jgi:hypothetical protein